MAYILPWRSIWAVWAARVCAAQAALDTLCPLGVAVAAHGRSWLAAQRMRAFLAVARGSCAEPMLVECAYRGARPQRPPVLLAAKGVTFDRSLTSHVARAASHRPLRVYTDPGHTLNAISMQQNQQLTPRKQCLISKNKKILLNKFNLHKTIFFP